VAKLMATETSCGRTGSTPKSSANCFL